MNKLLIIGLDGFDPDLFEKWDSGLPNLSLIKRKGFYTRLKSVFPPDSGPAWTTIYTGLNPDKHGIIHSIDYLEKNYRKLKFDFHIFKGKTFWDIAGFHKKKSLYYKSLSCLSCMASKWDYGEWPCFRKWRKPILS